MEAVCSPGFFYQYLQVQWFLSLFSLFFPFSGGEAAGINPKLTDILNIRLNAGHAIPLIECWVIQHLEVVQFSILI